MNGNIKYGVNRIHRKRDLLNHPYSVHKTTYSTHFIGQLIKANNDFFDKITHYMEMADPSSAI